MMITATRKRTSRRQAARQGEQGFQLMLERLESRDMLAASPIVTSTDGSITIGADFSSPEVHSLGWPEQTTNISIESGLPIVSGYFRTATSEVSLTGVANPTTTASIRVGGVEADWSTTGGTWSHGPLELNPGVNRIIVQAFDAGGNETDRGYTDIWFDNSGVSVLPVSVPLGSTWSYLDDGSDQGTSWRTDPVPTWESGAAQLGYGDGDESTVINSGPSGNRFVTAYFRHTFEIPAGQAAQYNEISIGLLRDDGAAVYINGTEVIRTDNLPGTLGDGALSYDTLADMGGTEENLQSTFLVPEDLVSGLLQDGENTIAVEVHQHDLDSSDLSFDLGLSASQAIPGVFQEVAGELPADTTTWTAADGPYFIVDDLTVPADGVLVIEAGTTVYFANEQSLIVQGRLSAEGSQSEIIRFTRVPGSTTISDGIQFDSTMQHNRISYAVIEWGGTSSNNGLIGLDDSKLTLDHVTLDHAERRRIRSIDSALTVQNSVFTDIFAPDAPPSTDNLSEHIWGRNVPAGEQFIVENNIFGITKGHNDDVDFDAGVRPDSIPQILNNTFLGGGDDAMDFEGDVHIEGNFIMNFIKDEWNTGSGNSNGISAGNGRHYVMSRNIFYNVEHVAQVKQDAFLTFVNNTVAGALISATYYQRPTGGEFGRGAYLDGNVFVDTQQVLDEYNDETDLTMNRSAITSDESDFGIGNITSEVMLTDLANYDFNLLDGSPAIDTGPNGIDMGALVPAGASITGEPPVLTQDTDARLIVGGPDTFAYRYRVDNGVWSGVVSVADAGTKEQMIPPIRLTELTPGLHRVQVIKQNSAGVWQLELDSTNSDFWVVDGDRANVIASLCAETYLDFPDARYDVNRDGDVDETDLVFLVEHIFGTAVGDANFDGRVDATDLNQLGIHWQQSGANLDWSQGNFNCDSKVDSIDLNELGVHWLFGVAAATHVPRAPLVARLPISTKYLVDEVWTAAGAPIHSANNDSYELTPTSYVIELTPTTRTTTQRGDRIARRLPSAKVTFDAAEQLVETAFVRLNSKCRRERAL